MQNTSSNYTLMIRHRQVTIRLIVTTPQFLFLVQLIEVAVAFTLRIAENHVGQESCYFKEKTLCINSSPKSNVITLRLV